MSRLVFRSGMFIILLLIFFSATSSGEAEDEVLLTVHDREITSDEFLYYFYKNYQVLNQQNIEEYLELFVNFQLKAAQAREERMDHNIGFINELTEYRLLLAAPYLTHKEKEQEFVREALERLSFEVNASHIVIRLDPGAIPEDTLKAYNEAYQLRKRILGGEPFEQLALATSGDHYVVRESGKPGYFTAFQTVYSFESAVYNMNPGEISMPVRSIYGYHIIRLNDKRKATGEMKTEDEIRDLIKEAKDERSQMIEDAFVEDLKIYWNFSENLEALEIICELADNSVYKGNWNPPSDHSFDEVLFMMDGKGVSQNDFINFMSDQETPYRNLSVREYIISLYRQFISSRLIKYENLNLEEKYPEFRFHLQEYRDAMLLLAITKKMVWSKAETDSEGLENFYAKNRKKYKALEEDHDVILDDYQDYLMNEWVNELRGIYEVKINEEVLSSLLVE